MLDCQPAADTEDEVRNKEDTLRNREEEEQDSAPAGAKQFCCIYCQEFQGDDQVYWDIPLDQDLLETIITIYPEWFDSIMAEEDAYLLSLPEGDQSVLLTGADSPQAAVDDASIQQGMDRNKKSLTVKLQLRRPINQLIDQGILPPMKASPVLYEQSKKLERARMEDFLKHKIQRRPDRQALIEQHILEDTTASPSLHDKQRQLKKARLADDLNDRLSHRPGPLELVKGNILLADDRLAQAIKEGQIQFKATSEGEAIKHPPPLFSIEDKEESSSEGTPSPPQAVPSPTDQSTFISQLGGDSAVASASAIAASIALVPTRPASLNSSSELTNSSSLSSLHLHSPATSLILTSPTPSCVPSPPLIQLQQQQAQPQQHQFFLGNVCALTTSTLKAPISTFVSLTQPSPAALAPKQTSLLHGTSSLPNATAAPGASAPATTTTILNQIKPAFTPGAVSKIEGFSKNKKKSKSKIQPKTRTIKFHEYKGPPNAQKNPLPPLDSSESSYELLLKQQQLFLQWQLEWQQKYPQLILPATQKMTDQQLHAAVSGTKGQPAIVSQQQTAQTILLPNRNTHHVHYAPEVVHITTAITSNSSNTSPTTTAPVVQANNNFAPHNYPKISPLPGKIVSKLEGMKVSDLKLELKKRNMPVSGSKPQLVDRLKPFADDVIASNAFSSSSLVPLAVRKPSDAGAKNKRADIPSPPPPASSSSVGQTNNKSPGHAESPKTPGDSRTPLNSGSDENTSISASGSDVLMDTTEDNAMPLSSVSIRKVISFPLNSETFDQADLKIQPPTSSIPTTVHYELDTARPFQLHQSLYTTSSNNQISLPLVSIAGSQIKILSAPQPTFVVDQTKSDQKQAIQQQQQLQQHHQQKIQSQAKNCRPQQQQPGSVSTASNSASAAVKASLAAFLHNQAQLQNNNQQQQQINGISTTIVPQFVSNDGKQQNVQQLLLAYNTQLPTVSKHMAVGEQRTNSLPVVSLTNSKMSQRTDSLPNFSSASFTNECADVKRQQTDDAMKPPPNYEEATKTTTPRIRITGKGRKKSIKSQDVDDVLDILIRSGELSPSAAQEPQTPLTPEKLRDANLSQLTFSLSGTPQQPHSHQQLPVPGLHLSNVVIKEEMLEQHDHGKLSVGEDKEMSDLDFSLELQEIANTMDFSALTQDTIDVTSAGIRWDSNHNDCNGQSASFGGNDCSLNELMDFQQSPVQMDWMSELSPSNQQHPQQPMANNKDYSEHLSREVPSGHHGLSDAVQSFNFKNAAQQHEDEGAKSNADSSSSNSPCSSNFNFKDHDPVLPNNMVGNMSAAHGDTLIDLFFDESELRGPQESFGNMVWDRLDFIA